MHPLDLDRLGLSEGDVAEITSARATILGVVAADPNFGAGPERDDAVPMIGGPTNRLPSVDDTYDRYSGQPLMSNVPVSVCQFQKPTVENDPD